ncbi:hypothetical protein MMC11_007238 [Xylographa trunciseda]|nr:hypothetical protein [Xylographa trunciseda]
MKLNTLHWRLLIILEELGLPYQSSWVELKKPPSKLSTPTGAYPPSPSWETGAITYHLVETYDPEEKFSYQSIPKKLLQPQWSYFQVSCRARMFNQLRHEKLSSAQERYGKEVLRVVGVLADYLTAHDKQYLVGGKCTCADLVFVCWDVSIDWSLANGPVKWDIAVFPAFQAWMERLKARPAAGEELGPYVWEEGGLE